jgi:hypothetical protein
MASLSCWDWSAPSSSSETCRTSASAFASGGTLVVVRTSTTNLAEEEPEPTAVDFLRGYLFAPSSPAASTSLGETQNRTVLALDRLRLPPNLERTSPSTGSSFDDASALGLPGSEAQESATRARRIFSARSILCMYRAKPTSLHCGSGIGRGERGRHCHVRTINGGRSNSDAVMRVFRVEESILSCPSVQGTY